MTRVSNWTDHGEIEIMSLSSRCDEVSCRFNLIFLNFNHLVLGFQSTIFFLLDPQFLGILCKNKFELLFVGYRKSFRLRRDLLPRGWRTVALQDMKVMMMMMMT